MKHLHWLICLLVPLELMFIALGVPSGVISHHTSSTSVEDWEWSVHICVLVTPWCIWIICAHYIILSIFNRFQIIRIDIIRNYVNRKDNLYLVIWGYSLSIKISFSYWLESVLSLPLIIVGFLILFVIFYIILQLIISFRCILPIG